MYDDVTMNSEGDLMRLKELEAEIKKLGLKDRAALAK